ncbi:hypothetical protein TNCV_5041731 [Trichonephila clavipes]|nr:hypothetical protein TNCV_5041731 [Trichonephila clavipes]
MGTLFIVRTWASADTQTGRHKGEKRTGTPLTIGEACLRRILSSRPVSREWDNRTQVVWRTRDRRRTLDEENLRRTLKKEGPRLEWKGRKDDERR